MSVISPSRLPSRSTMTRPNQARTSSTLGVGIADPPCPLLAASMEGRLERLRSLVDAAPGGVSRSLELPLDATLLHHPVPASHGPAPAPRREAAPEQRRDQQPEQPADHQDDPDGVEAEPGGVRVHGEGQDGADHKQEQTEADSHLVPPRTMRRGGQGSPRQTATTLKERRPDGDRYRHCHKPDKRRRFASP